VRFSRVSDKLGKQARAREQGQIKRAGTVDDIEPKAQNQDSPHLKCKKSVNPAFTSKMSSLLHLYLHNYSLYRFLIDTRYVYI
jgi:hypothetical protein